MPKDGAHLKDSQGYVLFSQRDFGALGDIGSLARGIKAPEGCDRFRTHILSEGAGSVQREEWFEAQRHPVAPDQWMVTRWERINGAGKDDEIFSRVIQPQLCFFDAMHYCAFQESGQRLGGNIVREEEQDPACPHYSAPADAVNIPLDNDGLPHPAAHGAIVITSPDSVFGKTARDVAARTKGNTVVIDKNLIKPAMPGNLIPFVAATNLPAKPINSDDFSQQQKSLKEFNRAVVAVDGLNNFIDEAMCSSFDKVKGNGSNMDVAVMCSVFGGAVLVPMTIAQIGQSLASILLISPVIGVLSAMVGFGFLVMYDSAMDSDADYNFRKNKNKLLKAAKKLPDDDKKLVRDFTRAAEVVYKMEKAATIFAEVQANEKPAKELNKGLKLVAQAAKLAGKSDKEIKALKEDYMSGRFGAPGTYAAQLQKSYEKVQSVLRHNAAQLAPPQLNP